MKENQELITKEEQEKGTFLMGFDQMGRGAKSKQEIFTTITDEKTLFNLESNCDYKINDCKGEKIRVKDVLIKRIITPLAEPIINEETGEIEKENEYKMITILIDDEGKSYVTASKIFTIQFMRLMEMYKTKINEIKENGIEIKIIEKAVKNSSNKALSFELL